jgi:glycosyltransferase involved in cell wall biosynthesis
LTAPVETPKVSVVIIARNEEQAIGQCLESVIAVTKDFASEILFVDSASTDRTVDIARQYAVPIVRFEPGSMFSPSAGRWLGTRFTRGEYLFFVDGDMMVVDGWLTHAFDVLRDPHLAGVGGRLFWVEPGEAIHMNRKDDLPLGLVRGLGGAGVYRRDVLESFGGFNPFLRGEEERELAYRLAVGGYSVVRVDVPMAIHLNKARSVTENVERSIYFTGIGQIMRRHPLRRICWDLVWEYRQVFSFAGFAGAALVLIAVLAMTGSYGVLFGLAITVLVGMTVLGLRKGPRRLWLYLHERLLSNISFLRGVFLGLPPAETYSAAFTWITKAR